MVFVFLCQETWWFLNRNQTIFQREYPYSKANTILLSAYDKISNIRDTKKWFSLQNNCKNDMQYIPSAAYSSGKDER